jgi:hypothetical protein
MTWGIGIQRIAISQRMLGMAIHDCVRSKLIHVASSLGSQSFSCDVHWNAAAKLHARFHAVEMLPIGGEERYGSRGIRAAAYTCSRL